MTIWAILKTPPFKLRRLWLNLGKFWKNWATFYLQHLVSLAVNDTNWGPYYKAITTVKNECRGVPRLCCTIYGRNWTTVVNLVKHFTIVIYDSRVVSLENCPYYNSRVVIYARKMFMVKWPLVIDKVRPCVGFRIWRQCVALLCWNQVLLLVVSSHVTSFNQSECFIKA